MLTFSDARAVDLEVVESLAAVADLLVDRQNDARREVEMFLRRFDTQHAVPTIRPVAAMLFGFFATIDPDETLAEIAAATSALVAGLWLAAEGSDQRARLDVAGRLIAGDFQPEDHTTTDTNANGGLETEASIATTVCGGIDPTVLRSLVEWVAAMSVSLAYDGHRWSAGGDPLRGFADGRVVGAGDEQIIVGGAAA